MVNLPLGFDHAIAQNGRAKDYFMSLSRQEQLEIIHRAKQLQSDEAMQNYINQLAKMK